MKVAVMSDIHGNLRALQAVLEDIKKQEIEKIYILGDLAFCGPQPKETLEFIRENLGQHTIIQGNTDEMIVKAKDEENDPYMPKKDIMANALKYAQQVLTDEDKEYLAKLPARHEEEIGGLKMLFVHGSPRKNDEGMFPETRYSMLEEMVEGIDARLIFCGHTHYPIIHQLGSKTIVNDGSVGRPFGENPRAVYVILDLTKLAERKYDVEHRYVKYDVDTASEEFANCNFDGSDILAYMLRKGTDKFPTPAELN
jgi:putative phosphoesterase